MHSIRVLFRRKTRKLVCEPANFWCADMWIFRALLMMNEAQEISCVELCG